MNVIFLDFDGVLDTVHHNSFEDIENKIIILSEICKEYNCKVVIEAAAKNYIDEKTLETDNNWVKNILDLLKKYDIDCIGRTPNVSKKINNDTYISMWKEYEIRLYLYRHPEIEHFCIIDDDDLSYKESDLDKLRDHLVKTIDNSSNHNEEGLLESHKDEIEKVLNKDNMIRTLVLKNIKNV